MNKLFKAIALMLAVLTVGAAAAACKKAVKPVILAVSFGTSYNDSREKTIGAIEKALEKEYPNYEVRRAFTAQIVIDILKERDKIEVDNVKQAMERLVADGVKDVIIQPTHIMSGYEYDDVVKEVKAYESKFNSLKIAKTMLIEDSDYDAMAAMIEATTKDYNVDGNAIVYMGHGTEHAANETYAKLQQKLTAKGMSNYFIGTVEAEPSVEDVLELVKAGGYKKVVLIPFMIVCGDHANNDMAGDEEDSWKSVFEGAGYEVVCVVEGLGGIPAVQEILTEHAQAAADSVK